MLKGVPVCSRDKFLGYGYPPEVARVSSQLLCTHLVYEAALGICAIHEEMEVCLGRDLWFFPCPSPDVMGSHRFLLLEINHERNPDLTI